MFKSSFYLDCRRAKADSASPLRIALRVNGERSYFPTGIELFPKQWDLTRQRVVAHTQKALLNAHLKLLRQKFEQICKSFDNKGWFDKMPTSAYRELIMNNFSSEINDEDIADLCHDTKSRKPEKPVHSPYNSFLAYIRSKTGRTAKLYETTLNRIIAFCPDFETLKFEDINYRWLEDWESWMSQTAKSANGRAIHLRNLRAVFNRAIDEEITTFYPFRRFKIKHEKTRKRSLSIDQLRRVFTMKCKYRRQQKYLDCFKIIFMLCGINFIDLANLKMFNGDRIEYRRAKTKRLYDIKVEPEARTLIEKYEGKNWLLNYLDSNADYRSFYAHLNTTLHEIGTEIGVPGLTSYWARHSWATVAASLDIPKETIAAALGHGGNTVTDVYIDFDQRKVDVANRRVIDFVLYGKS